MFDLGLKETFFVLRKTKGNKKYIFKHFFRLPTEQDWVKYHLARNFMGLSKGKDTFEFANVMQKEDLAFWDNLIVRAEGYLHQSKDLMTLEDWKEKIPVDHKLNAIGGFLIFNREELPESELIETEGYDLAGGGQETELVFDAVQDGASRQVKFYFMQPEMEDFMIFNRLASKMQVVRTKQRNVSELRVPADIRPFVKLFDKLITKVVGYGFGGKELMKAEEWKIKIDAYHKREAIRELFTASQLEEEVGN